MRTKVFASILLTLLGFLTVTPNASARSDGWTATRIAAATPVAAPAADPVVPRGCVGWHNDARFRNYAGLYEGGGACSRCGEFGAHGIYQGLWDDWQCVMRAGGSYLLVELWVHTPGNP